MVKRTISPCQTGLNTSTPGETVLAKSGKNSADEVVDESNQIQFYLVA
jgi:hypothetical protein